MWHKIINNWKYVVNSIGSNIIEFYTITSNWYSRTIDRRRFEIMALLLADIF